MTSDLSVWVVYNKETQDLWTSSTGQWKFINSETAHEVLYMETQERANEYDSKYIIEEGE